MQTYTVSSVTIKLKFDVQASYRFVDRESDSKCLSLYVDRKLRFAMFIAGDIPGLAVPLSLKLYLIGSGTECHQRISSYKVQIDYF